jgi:hypothetical protein
MKGQPPECGSSPPRDPNEVKAAIDAIDFEIAEVRGEHRGSGWTLWGVLAALAAIAWLTAALLKSEAVSQVVVLRVFFLGSLVIDIVVGLATAFGLQYPLFPLRAEKRLPMGSRIPFNGLEVLISLGRNAALCWIVAFMWPEVGRLVHVTAYAYLALPLPLMLLALGMRFLAFPVRVGVSKAMVRIQAAAGLVILALPAILLSKYSLVFFQRTYATVADYQLASLLLAALFLLGRLARLYRHAPTLAPLIEVRRDLVFRRIGPDEALRRVESTIVGKTAAELISEAVEPLRIHLGESNSYKRAMRAADVLEAKYRTQAGSPGIVPAIEVARWWKKDVGRWAREQTRMRWRWKWLMFRLKILTGGDSEADEAASKELKSLVGEGPSLGKPTIALMDRRLALLGKTRPTQPDGPAVQPPQSVSSPPTEKS